MYTRIHSPGLHLEGNNTCTHIYILLGPPTNGSTLDPLQMVLPWTPNKWSYLGSPTNGPTLDPQQMVLPWTPYKWSHLGPPTNGPTLDPQQMVLPWTPYKWSYLGPPTNGPTLDPLQMVLPWTPNKWSYIGPPTNGPTLDPLVCELLHQPLHLHVLLLCPQLLHLLRPVTGQRSTLKGGSTSVSLEELPPTPTL